MSLKPHVLALPSWYPAPQSPLRGIFFQEQIRALREAGIPIGVTYPELRRLRTINRGGLSRNWFQMTTASEKGIPTVRLKGWNVPIDRFRKVLFVRLATRVFEHYVDSFGEPDLIHAHSALWGGVAARHIAESYGLPFIITEHSSAFGRDLLKTWQEDDIHDAFSAAVAVIAVSKTLARDIQHLVPQGKISVVPNMVNTDFFNLPPHRRSADPCSFVTVAGLESNKGVDSLIQAFANAFGENRNVRLVVVGDGRSRKSLEELAVSLKISDQVTFAGQLSRSGVRRELWDANIFVLASRIETFGVVLIEAMATGLPVVATRSGGPEEIITDDVGWLVEPENVESLADALEAAYEDESAMRLRAGKIREHVVDHFSEEVVTARLRDIYRSVLGGYSVTGHEPE